MFWESVILFYWWAVFHCMGILHFVYQFESHLAFVLFLILCYYKFKKVQKCEYRSMCAHTVLFPLGTKLMIGITWLYVKCLTFWETGQHFYIHQKCMRVPVAPYFHHHLVLPIFLLYLFLCVWRYLRVVLITFPWWPKMLSISLCAYWSFTCFL